MGFLEKIKYIYKEVMFPKKCMLCGKYIDYKNKYFICSECYTKHISHTPNLYQRHTYGIGSIDSVYYAMKYTGKPRKSLHKFKFDGKSFYGDTFGRILYEACKGEDFMNDITIVTCVPSSKKHLRNRGYNQADIIAKAFCKYADLNYANDILIKVKDIPPMNKLTKGQRFKLIKNAFAYNDKHILFDAHVLLIDDVYTTGATSGECARVLKRKGVEKVTVLTLFSNDYGF